MTMRQTIRVSLLAVAAIAYSLPANSAPLYPTSTLAEYVYGCMKANGENRDILQRCSCSIDVIASVVSYDDYVAAETFKSMALAGGENASLFLSSAPAKAATTKLKQAQAEADIRCF
jgi:hypothetical protein